MNLKDWIIKTGVVKAAEQLDIGYTAVSNWKQYRAVPEPKTARKIVKLTKGKVSYDNIYEPYFSQQTTK